MWIVWFSLYMTVAALVVYLVMKEELLLVERSETFATYWVEDGDTGRQIAIGIFWPVAGPVWVAWLIAKKHSEEIILRERAKREKREGER
jgi:hypothetical protein